MGPGMGRRTKTAGNVRGRCALLFVVPLFIGLFGGMCSSMAHAADAIAAALPLLPMPAQVQHAPGHFEVTAKTIISVSPGDAAAVRAAHDLADLLNRTRHLRLAVRVQSTAPAAAIRLQLDPHAAVEQVEGYALDVDTHGVLVSARSSTGLFYGAMTLWQLLTPDSARGAVQVPALAIRDWPRFAWRGLMLDVARHYQSPATIKQLLDAMAEHKLNVFHWHLTDDQGWRIEIKRYPELTRIGAWRTPPGAGSGGVPKRYGGFYTQAQIRDIVAYAAARHITVVPELDMPGHAQAAVAAYPRMIGITGQRPAVSVDWGVNPYLYNVDDTSFGFIEHVLDEVMALFPSTYIHVGGDEAIKDQWKASPAVQAKMRTLGIKDEEGLQSWFIDRIGRYLATHGRRLIGWDEILEGGLPASASVMSWRGTQGAIDAARMGHDVVLAPSGSLYFDNLQSARADEPSGRLAILPLSKVYAFEPVDASLDAEQARHVLGLEAALWTEYVPSGWHVQHAVFPRIYALAERAWSPSASRDWQDFLARLPAQLRRYRAQGIAFADSAFAVETTLEGEPAAGKVRVSLDNQARYGDIRYTIDGSAPTIASPAYAAPFEVTLPATVRALAFAAEGTPLAAARTRTLDRAALATHSSSELHACPGGDLGLRVPLLPDRDRPDTPVYNVDLFHSCWIYPHARLDGVAAIHVDAARLARNYGLAHDQAKVVAYPARTAHGELEVRLDTCDGTVLARLPLPAGDAPGTRFDLHGALPPHAGNHDLCLRFTAPIHGPLYAIGSVQLLDHAVDARRRPESSIEGGK
jgi:hexosaminidase